MLQTKQVFTNLFNYLYQKKIFGLLIIGSLITAVVSWFYLTSAIQANINYRLEQELDRIANVVTMNLANYANTLSYVHAYFKTEGLPNRQDFRRLAESIEIQRVNHGIQGLGYIAIVRKEELPYFLAQHRQQPFFNTETLKPGRELYAPITMVEPLTMLRAKRLGADLLTEESRRDAIFTAMSSSGITLSKPIVPIYISDSAATIMLMIPFYKTLGIPPTAEERAQQVRGLIYIPIRLQGFFEAALGKPSKRDETVNFMLQGVDAKGVSEVPLYKRFDLPAEKGSMTLTRTIDLYGHKWKISVTTFSPFFSFGDRYLANSVALIFILFIGLLFSIFKQTRNLLSHEKRSKEWMEANMLHSREQTAKLKRLNDINGQIGLDLDQNQIVKDFFNASLPVSQSSHAFLYCASNIDSPEQIPFFQSWGFLSSELEKRFIKLSELNELMPENMIRKARARQTGIFAKFLKAPDHFVDWVFISIPSREFRRCGLLFLARSQHTPYSDIDIEIIESMVSQLGVRIDNSRLFKKVEDANKMKTAFLSNMSHEIRTPLNAIAGYSEILEQATAPEQKHVLMEGIKKNTKQLTSIIDNILDISKVEFGQILIHKRKIPIRSLIRDIESVVEMNARAKNISFQIENIGALPEFIVTDESRLKQILINLIGNAIKFTEQGSVVLQVRCKYEEGKDALLFFDVVDTGIGISLSSQISLFQSFNQADVSNTRKFGGLGLGLALSRRLAQQIGGDVTLIKSHPAEGSTFQLQIPCGDLPQIQWIQSLSQPSNSALKTESKISQPLLKNKKILVVEDSEDNQDIFQFFLESAGASPEIINNGEDAVKKSTNSDYDLILMDIQLPKMDGLEATRLIRQSGYKNPIIALTAHASVDEKLGCLQAGCVDLITKPVTQALLIKRIETILEEQQHV